MHNKNRGFTLVEVLVAMLLLCVVILFVTQLWFKLVNASELAETAVGESISSSELLQQLQEAFMQGKQLQTVDSKVIVLTADESRSFEIVDNALLMDDKQLASLIRGSITADNNSVSFDLVTQSGKTLQATFYILGG